MKVCVEKGKLVSIIGKLREATERIDNAEITYEYEGGENEDIINELQTSRDVIEDVIEELRRIVFSDEVVEE